MAYPAVEQLVAICEGIVEDLGDHLKPVVAKDEDGVEIWVEGWNEQLLGEAYHANMDLIAEMGYDEAFLRIDGLFSKAFDIIVEEEMNK